MANKSTQTVFHRRTRITPNGEVIIDDEYGNAENRKMPSRENNYPGKEKKLPKKGVPKTKFDLSDMANIANIFRAFLEILNKILPFLKREDA
jgi:hypothetical protein